MTPEAQQLIDDLQALDGPSREMDARIYNYFFSSAAVSVGGMFPAQPKYTSSIDSSMTLIPDGFLFGGIRPINKDEFQCELISKTVVGCYKYGEHKSIPIAIIIAAIKAGEVEREMK